MTRKRLDHLEARSRYWGHGQGNAIADDLHESVELARELATTLRELLEDTQHRDHDCGDALENCPVLKARALLAKLAVD